MLVYGHNSCENITENVVNVNYADSDNDALIDMIENNNQASVSIRRKFDLNVKLEEESEKKIHTDEEPQDMADRTLLL